MQFALLPFLRQLKTDFLHWLQGVQLFLLSLFTSWKFYAVLFVISLPFLLYLNYRLHFRAFEKKRQFEEEKRQAEEKCDEIKELLNKSIEYFSSEELNSLTLKLDKAIFFCEKYDELKGYLDKLYEKYEEAEKQMEIAVHKEHVEELRDKEGELKEKIQSLKYEKEKREHEEREKRDAILEDLEIYENPVFGREDVSEKEVGALLESGYFRINEFCPYEQKMITVLVKPTMQHSKTHTFLVWSIKKILEDMEGVKNVMEHLTKDADLTFVHDRKTYALEIETGTLLGKKEQLKEKIASLNRKYQTRWLILVSHRDLFSKYRDFGRVATRKNVRKMLEKLLKNAHSK